MRALVFHTFISYRSYFSHYDYDLNGNTTDDGVAFYTYDSNSSDKSENRLTGATNVDGTTAGLYNSALVNPFF